MTFRCQHRMKLLLVYAMSVFLWTSAHAQALKSPMGELRIGMSEAGASRVLHSNFREIGGINILRERIASMRFADEWFAAAATSKHVVYSVSTNQFFPNGELGRRAANNMVQRYHREFGPSAAISSSKREGIKYQGWQIPGGATASVELHCGDTLVITKFSDYSRKTADNGSDSLRYVTMGPFIDPECF